MSSENNISKVSADTLNSDDLTRLSTAINLLGIKHNELKEGKHSFHFNLSDAASSITDESGFEITDNANVFIKLDRGNGECQQLRAELEGLNHAHNNGIPCPKPLWPEVCSFIDGDGNKREFVVVEHIGNTTMAEWINGRKKHDNSDTYDISQDIMDCLNVAKEIHSVQLPENVDVFNVVWIETAAEILTLFNTLPAATNETEYTEKEAEHLKGRFLRVVEELRINFPMKGNCWVHGDFHLTNLIHQGPSKVIPVDWELHWNGTPEYDIAQFARDLMLYDVLEKVDFIKPYLNETYGEGVIDFSLLNLLAEYRTIWSVIHLWNTSGRGYGTAKDFQAILHRMWDE